MEKYGSCTPEQRISLRSLYTAFETQREKEYYFEGEAHNFWEMVCVLGGSIGATADNDVYSLCAGQVIFHKPMEFHRLWSDEGTSPFTCIFSFSGKMPELNGRVFSLSVKNQERVRHALAMIEEFYEIDDIDVLSVKEGKENEAYAALCYLEYLILSIVSQKAETGAEVSTPSARKYAEIVGIMDNNINNRLSLEDIAFLCNMSVSNLKKVFFRYSGQGVSRYFSELKMRRAVMMLNDGKSVKETSYALGFDDQNYFSTVFKRIMGKSPVQYKKENT